MSWFLRLDLGQAQDFSALVALRRRGPVSRGLGQYVVRGVKRWPLRTPCTTIAADVVTMLQRPPMANCTLGVDRTGCGRPVVDMLRQPRPAAMLRPILITAGHESKPAESGGHHVPKKELCATTYVLLQSGRLEIPSTIPEAAVLGKELLAFRAKITTAGNETLENDWRSAAHDDLVLALAIAAWLGEQAQPFYFRLVDRSD
ncbi:MAG: hypothetical protein K2R98_02650 [Gemmataceae bacterium]|nr:hypothetical protein [Gemmataceae bacterium]